MAIDLYIVAAGIGSRMGPNSCPKALMDVGDKTNLQNTLEKAEGLFQNVYVVANEFLRTEWQSACKKLPSNLQPELLFISSGLGDGHATLSGLNAYKKNQTNSKNSIIVWGDVYIPSRESFIELLSNRSPADAGLVPVVYKRDPYVCLETEPGSGVITGAKFTKLGEHVETGAHDQSIFFFKTDSLQKSLTKLHNCLWRNNSYMTVNGELSLLFVFHEMFNSRHNGIRVFETKFPTVGFNTVEELEQIRNMNHV